MCGIVGIVHLDGKSVDRDILDRMTDSLKHRGPDGRGIYINANVGLGHRRLAILDVTDAGAQPMKNNNGNIVVTYNGEIYNFQEERAKLESKGYQFHTRCDTEVLIALYEEYGEQCVHYLRGMFSFAVYDKEKNILFCARDRVGEKPFRYCFDGKVFLFASEIKALRNHPNCPREIDREAIHHFLTFMYLPSPMTGFSNIKKLPSGHSMTVNLSSGAISINRYWQLDFSHEDSFSTEEWIDRIRSSLDESVEMRMISDVPIGAFLSGGIDSAAVTTMMSRRSKEPIRTFSIGTTIESHNELPDAKIVSESIGSEHHPMIVTPDVMRLLPELVKMYEEPFADPSTIPTYLISQFTSSHVKVALTGDGGDENFAGYVRYPILQFSELWNKMRILHPAANGLTAVMHTILQNTFSYRCRRFQMSMNLPWERRLLQYISFFTEEEKQRMSHCNNFQRTDELYAALTKSVRSSSRDLLHQALAMDIETYLPDDLMPKVDMAAMHFGLECRAPFLDHHFMELTARIPHQRKLRGMSKKVIFKQAMRGVLPEEILRKQKRGFRLPLNAWMRGELNEFVRDRLLSDAPHKWEILKKDGVEQFLQHYESTRIDYSDHLWALLWLDEWLRQYT